MKIDEKGVLSSDSILVLMLSCQNLKKRDKKVVLQPSLNDSNKRNFRSDQAIDDRLK